ncbi:patatin-like phospholipase family protein [Roseomonas sp. AR75]|uniref:patatin-like phospholipase family protein n=1 Tax=Roseomonas sp. AR75 TaxID=2562311 RepID=UPI0010BF9356|nr:patatin-like phospholipase family protein [Roseomonas sp. AR75]
MERPVVTSAARLLLLLLMLSGLAACASIARLDPPPPLAAEEAAIFGIPNARFMADGPVAPWEQEAAAAATRRRAADAQAGRVSLPPANYLALSGGGDNGAFGAGLLTGWSESGTRPEFDVVTGISAGALIAPFAFLGSAYDPQLRAVFNDVGPGDILVVGRIVTALLFGEAIADASPLYRLIERHADQAMLEAIAREYRRGRLLLIGTTNLDIRRAVVWNIGAIAASGHPEALGLFRRILLASASVPGAFPPVFIDMELEGRRFQEMHVDGGAAMQVFLYPPSLDLRRAAAAWGAQRQRTAWVVRNGRIDVESAPTNRSVFRIARRSVETLLHYSGIADIHRIHLTTTRDGVAFRLAAIGPDFDAPREGPFDPTFMRALFAYGREQGRSGAAWMDRPPPVGIIAPDPEPGLTALAP